jgi:hypothetical protein
VATLFVVGLATQVVRTLSKRNDAASTTLAAPGVVLGLLAGWALIGLLPGVIAHPASTRVLLSAPPIFLLAGIGAAALYQAASRHSPRRARPVLGALFAVVLVSMAVRSYSLYFYEFAEDERTRRGYQAQVTSLAELVNSRPRDEPKYIVRQGRSTHLPIRALRFLTQSFTSEDAAERNIHYLREDEEEKLTGDGLVIHVTRYDWDVVSE